MASCTSTLSTSPSFNTHSSNNIADIADRVVHELLSENNFTFIDDSIQPDEDEHDFEFPVICTDSNSSQIVTESISDEKISPRYPLFDRSLLTDVDSKPAPEPAKRASLMKLFNEDRETVSTSNSNSSSESDDLDGISPETYCVWTPKADSHPHPPRGKHKKSNSISIGNTSNRWKVRDLLKRSYSDDNYTVGKDSPVFLFVPPVSPEKVNIINNNNNKNDKKKVPAYKSKIGNIHLPPFLPYRQDQINFNGLNSKNNMYRY